MRTLSSTGPHGPPRTRRAGLAALVATLAVALVVAATAGVTTPAPGAPVQAVAAGGAGADPVPAVAFDGEAGDLTGISTHANAAVTGTAARRGAGGLRLSAADATAFARWGPDAVPQGHGYAAVRSWVRVVDRGPGQSVDLLTVSNSQGFAHFDLFVSGATQRFQWDLWWEDTDQSDFVVAYDRWYLVEAVVEFDGSTHSAEVRIDGVEQGRIESSGEDADVRMLTVGTHVAKTHTQHYDDVEMAVGDGPLDWLADEGPSVTVTSPAEGATFGSGDVVTADFRCGPGDHPVTSCAGTVADGAPLASSIGDHQLVVTARDQAGHTTTVTRSYTVVDGEGPVVAVRVPAAGAVIARDARVATDYDCADESGGSGLAPGGCAGPVPSGARLDTSTPGRRLFTVTGTDQAGNATVVEQPYRVAPNRPDLLVRPARAARFVGDRVYNRTGSRQTLLSRVGRNRSAAFVVRLQNDGAARDTFRLRGTPSDPRWSVRWFSGAREITGAVARGRHRVVMAPRATRVLRLVIRPKASAGRGAAKGVTLTATAPNPAHGRDRVGVIVVRA